MNRRQQMHDLLLQALESPHGIILKVSGDSPNKKQAAITALGALKRELLPDEPRMLNIQLRVVSGREDEIAIVHIQEFDPTSE